MKNILIVEDNEDVNLMLAKTLNEAGYNVSSKYSGLDGLNEIKNNTYDLILLDIMLPYKSGDEILKEVRQYSNIPIIIISAKDITSTKIDMLRLGGDDYITKPFDLGEVVARVESNLRRYLPYQNSTLYKYKDLTLNEDTKEVKIKDTLIDLTAKEYKILELLIKSPTKVFTKANIYESVWEDEYLGDDKTVKTHFSNIRNKLHKINDKENYIETVWGLGYRLYKE